MRSYKEIYDETIRSANALSGAGVRQNDYVAIITENRFEFLPIAFGTICLNAAITPINLIYSERKYYYT
jgi:acyl-CoA synthetase (AMP-forming)/AMP-acid ligase II